MAELVDRAKAEGPALPVYGRILCCLCGISIAPNAAAMCMQCLQTQVSITEGIPTEGEIVFCKKCERWQVGPDHWVAHELESNGLLTVLMKKMSALSDHRLKVIDAAWIWTEHHSKRLKFMLEIEKGVLDDKLTLRQKVTVEYTIKNKQCLDCIHESTDHTWGALVQLRQGGGSKKTFHYLESLLTKHNLYNLMIDVTTTKEGLDLFFRARNQADKVVDFIQSVLPTRLSKSKKLVSRDLNSNVSRWEITYMLEVVPLHRGDLIITSKALVGKQDIFVVNKISSLVHCLQPQTLQQVDFSAAKYFALSGSSTAPVIVLAREKQLRRFLVLDVTPLDGSRSQPAVPAAAQALGVRAEAVVAREEDMQEYVVTTHLGHLLQPGDYAMGYDLQHSALSVAAEGAMEGLKQAAVPDVVLIRKHFEEREGGRGRRKNKNRVPPWRRDRGAAGTEALGEGDVLERATGKASGSGDADTQATVVGSEDASALRHEDEDDGSEDEGSAGEGGSEDDYEDYDEDADDYEPAFVDEDMVEVP